MWDANLVFRPQLYEEVLTLVDAARDAAALQPDGSDLPPAKCWQLVEVVRSWGMYYEHLTCSYVQEANPSGVWVSGRDRQRHDCRAVPLVAQLTAFTSYNPTVDVHPFGCIATSKALTTDPRSPPPPAPLYSRMRTLTVGLYLNVVLLRR